jgi:cysteine desulfurase
MGASHIYLDHNATTPLDYRVGESMKPFLESRFLNPSSAYGLAQSNREVIETARARMLDLLNASEGNLIFTGGGSEANNLAIKGVAFANMNRGKHIITSPIEHHAVLEPCEFLETLGFEVSIVPVDRNCQVKLGVLNDMIREDTILVSIMFANNETGVVQPIRDIAKITREKGVYFHTDAIQAAGKLALNVDELGVDLLSISAHKFYGPKGVGALYIRNGVEISSLVHGGGQEKGLRAGTENVAGIVGIARALELACKEADEDVTREQQLRDYLESGILKTIPDCLINGNRERRLPNTLNITFKYVVGEALLSLLEAEGILVSTGSACSSGSQEASHVLRAMGISDEEAHGALRFSLGRHTRKEDIDRVLDKLPGIVSQLRSFSPMARK